MNFMPFLSLLLLQALDDLNKNQEVLMNIFQPFAIKNGVQAVFGALSRKSWGMIFQPLPEHSFLVT